MRRMLMAVLAAGCLALAGTGCGDDSGWYGQARRLKAVREKRMRELEGQGMSREQAAAAWNQELSVRQTEGAPPPEGG